MMLNSIMAVLNCTWKLSLRHFILQDRTWITCFYDGGQSNLRQTQNASLFIIGFLKYRHLRLEKCKSPFLAIQHLSSQSTPIVKFFAPLIEVICQSEQTSDACLQSSPEMDQIVHFSRRRCRQYKNPSIKREAYVQHKLDWMEGNVIPFLSVSFYQNPLTFFMTKAFFLNS